MAAWLVKIVIAGGASLSCSLEHSLAGEGSVMLSSVVCALGSRKASTQVRKFDSLRPLRLCSQAERARQRAMCVWHVLGFSLSLSFLGVYSAALCLSCAFAVLRLALTRRRPQSIIQGYSKTTARYEALPSPNPIPLSD